MYTQTVKLGMGTVYRLAHQRARSPRMHISYSLCTYTGASIVYVYEVVHLLSSDSPQDTPAEWWNVLCTILESYAWRKLIEEKPLHIHC